MKDNFTLGLVGAPFGLEGFVKVRPFSGETEHLLVPPDSSGPMKVILRQNGKEKIHEIAEIQTRGDFLIMRFRGIDSLEEAALLSGAEIIAGRELAAPLKEDEFYVEDLKGLELIAPDGQVLGKITDIIDGGGAQLAEILLVSQEKKFIPFRKEFIGGIDLPNRRLILLEPWILE